MQPGQIAWLPLLSSFRSVSFRFGTHQATIALRVVSLSVGFETFRVWSVSFSPFRVVSEASCLKALLWSNFGLQFL
jgi:hypothetical protein